MGIWLRLHWKKLVFLVLLAGAAGFGFVRKGMEERFSAEWIQVNQEMQSLLSASEEGESSTAASPGGHAAASPAAEQPGGGSATAAAKTGLIDINTASASRLDELPGIGPGKAKAIVDYRQAQGPFRTPEELKKVKGIGQKTYDGLKDRITASAAP